MTAAEIQAELTLYTTARNNVLTLGQASDVSGRQFTRADIKHLDQKIAELRFALQRSNNQPTHSSAVFRTRT